MVLKRSEETHLECHFMAREVIILKYRLTERGIDVIKQLPPPFQGVISVTAPVPESEKFSWTYWLSLEDHKGSVI